MGCCLRQDLAAPSLGLRSCRTWCCMWHQLSGSDHPTLAGARAHLLPFVPAPWTRAKPLAVSEEGPQGPAMLSERLAAQLGLPEHQRLPYTNTRLVLASEVTDDDYFFGGTVVRCWVDPHSHPAVRQTLQGLEFRCAGAFPGGCRPPAAPGCCPTARLSRPCVSWPPCRRVSLGALAVQAIVNKRGAPHARLPCRRRTPSGCAALPAGGPRPSSALYTHAAPLLPVFAGPDGIVGVIPGEEKHSARCAGGGRALQQLLLEGKHTGRLPAVWRLPPISRQLHCSDCNTFHSLCKCRGHNQLATLAAEAPFRSPCAAIRPLGAPDSRRTFLRSSLCRLLQLCQQCHDNGEVLACTLPSADVVLVPRLPGTAAQVRRWRGGCWAGCWLLAGCRGGRCWLQCMPQCMPHARCCNLASPLLPASQDGMYFLAYATCLRAVELCERLRQESKVAVVLDLGAY